MQGQPASRNLSLDILSLTSLQFSIMTSLHTLAFETLPQHERHSLRGRQSVQTFLDQLLDLRAIQTQWLRWISPGPIGLETRLDDIVDVVALLITLEAAARLGDLAVKDAEQPCADLRATFESAALSMNIAKVACVTSSARAGSNPAPLAARRICGR